MPAWECPGGKLASHDPRSFVGRLRVLLVDGRSGVWEDGLTTAEKYYARKQLGLCVRCGQELGGDATVLTCPKCSRTQRSSWQAWRARRVADGGCVGCPGKAENGLRHCNACSVERRAYFTAKRRALKAADAKRAARAA